MIVSNNLSGDIQAERKDPSFISNWIFVSNIMGSRLNMVQTIYD